MKKFTLSFFVLLIFRSSVFANGETLQWLYTDATGNQTWEQLVGETPPQAPCNTIFMMVTYTAPAGYSFYKYTWTVNGVVVKTQTAVSDYYAYGPIIANGDNKMMCAVTYINSSGGTVTMNSNVLDFLGDQLGVQINQANDAVSGCTSPVSFTTSTFSGSFLFDPPSANYSVSWVPPTGWTVASESSNGQSVSFIPDASDGGAIVANLTYNNGCTYTSHVSTSITRTVPATSFSTSNPTSVCQQNGSATLAITPMCGASSYTYTVSGNATFAANGAQSYTTSATSVAANFPGASPNVFYCTVNYPNGPSSQAGWAVSSGLPVAPTGCKLASADCPEYSFTCDAAPPNETYNWNYVNLSNFQETNVGGGTTCCTRINFSPGTGNFVVQVTATNGCGTGPQTAISASPNCGGVGGHSIAPHVGLDSGKSFDDSSAVASFQTFTVYPNPANSFLKINLGGAQNTLSGIQSVFLYNSLGVQVAGHIYKDAPRQVILYLTELPSGVYLVKVGDDKRTVSKTVLVAK